MSPWLRIFRKETRELFRDRRVVMGAFVMPILMIWLMSGLFSRLEGAMSKGTMKLEIGLVGPDDNPLVTKMEESDRTTFTPYKSEEAATKALRDGDVRLVLVFPKFELGKQQEVRAVYDSQTTMSQVALGAFSSAVDKANQEAAKQVLTTKGIDSALLEVIKVKNEDLRNSKSRSGTPWMSLLPYLIVLWAFYGGFSIASDLVAGEKEKGTLETLLVTPAARRDVVIGKWLALAVCCFLSSMTSLLGLVLAGLAGKAGGILGPGGLTLTSGLGLIAVLIPLVLLFASVLLMVSAYAKSVRESQTYLTLISFLVLMPAVMSQFVGITGEDRLAWVHWTPVLNSAVAMGGALKGSFDASLVGKAVVVDLILAAIFLIAAWRHFHREQILNRT